MFLAPPGLGARRERRGLSPSQRSRRAAFLAGARLPKPCMRRWVPSRSPTHPGSKACFGWDPSPTLSGSGGTGHPAKVSSFGPLLPPSPTQMSQLPRRRPALLRSRLFFFLKKSGLWPSAGRFAFWQRHKERDQATVFGMDPAKARLSPQTTSHSPAHRRGTRALQKLPRNRRLSAAGEGRAQSPSARCHGPSGLSTLRNQPEASSFRSLSQEWGKTLEKQQPWLWSIPLRLTLWTRAARASTDNSAPTLSHRSWEHARFPHGHGLLLDAGERHAERRAGPRWQLPVRGRAADYSKFRTMNES